MLINFISQILTNATAIRAMKKERVEIFQDILLVRVIQDSLVMEHTALVRKIVLTYKFSSCYLV
jgi:predicted transcriptional regulator